MKAFIFVIVGLLSSTTYAGEGYMDPLRYDQSIPEACRDLDVENFDPQDLEYITFSIDGAEDKGFTHEYPMSRDGARNLWYAIRAYVKGDRRPPQFKDKDLMTHFNLLTENYEKMDFDFQSEGEVLEILAILELRKSLSPDFFITGSLAYRDQLAGELDIVIGEVDTCKVRVVGEAKLNVRRLGYARKQLERFKKFIRSHAASLWDIDPTQRLLSPM